MPLRPRPTQGRQGDRNRRPGCSGATSPCGQRGHWVSRMCPLAHWAKCHCSVGPQPTCRLVSGPLSSSRTWQAEHGSRSQTWPLHTAPLASAKLAADLATPIPLYRQSGPAAPRASLGSVGGWPGARGSPPPTRLPRRRLPARPAGFSVAVRLPSATLVRSLALCLSCLLHCDCREHEDLATYSERVPRS